MAVLSDRSIRQELARRRIVIDPLWDDAIQPASVDLHLDRVFRIFKVTRRQVTTKGDLVAATALFRIFKVTRRPYVDVREPTEDLTERVVVADDEPFVVQPGAFVLAGTIETIVLPDDIVARVDGKSSLGRLGLLVHATAGYVDPGWSGKLTLELSNQSQMPIALYYGMKIAQVSFYRLSTPVERPYGSPGLGSKYQGQREPTPSLIHLDWRGEA